MSKPRKPIVIETEALERTVETAPTPAEAPPVPDPDFVPEGQAMQSVAALAARPPSLLVRIFWSSLIALVGMGLSIAAWDFVAGLLERNVWLGRIALGLVLLFLFACILIVLREISAFFRLRRMEGYHQRAEDILAQSDRAGALALTDDLARLYKGRAECASGLAELERRKAEIMDADALVDLAERSLMQPLDAKARREVEVAARHVAGATALIPLALADVIAALTANVRMVRRIAEVYGGRAGLVGSWRLLRTVAAHLIATGAVAVGDDLIGSVAGGGLLSKLSRRFGEGIINGALTARVGIAAMEVCRPIPFNALEKPGVTSLVRTALTGMFSK